MLTTIILLCAPVIAADDPGGWPELFPKLGNYGLKVEAPKAGAGEKPKVYSQSGRYDWLGGRYEVVTITVARDPAFKEKYSAEAMAKEKKEKNEINKRATYLWTFSREKDIQKVTNRLVVVLAEDKVITIEQVGSGLNVAEVAKKLDFDKITKALDEPPPAKPKKE
jgi:hypothetical protein